MYNNTNINSETSSVWAIASFSILSFVSLLICCYGWYKGKEHVKESESNVNEDQNNNPTPILSLLPNEDEIIKVKMKEPKLTLLDYISDDESL